VLFGLAALIWPNITLQVLVLLFGAYALVDGVLAAIAALANQAGPYRGWTLLAGVAGIILGVLTFIYPDITQTALLYLIAAWAIVTGFFEILGAIELRKVIEGEIWLVLSGLASIVFGVIVALQPAAGALAIVWLIGIYAIAYGIALLVLGFRLRDLDKQLSSQMASGA
jgi:uncharacterized membrane protein HdeD (DUF308 family)